MHTPTVGKVPQTSTEDDASPSKGKVADTRLSDAILKDFIDGRLSVEIKQAIADSAAMCPLLRARIADMRKRPATGALAHTNLGPSARPFGLRTTAILALFAGAILAIALDRLSGIARPTHTAHGASSAIALSRGAIDQASRVHRALEATPDGQDVPLVAEQGSAKVLTTFRTSDGRYCREFDVAFEARDAYAGLACRIDADRWHLEALVATPATPPSSPYATASTHGADLLAQTIEAMKTESAYDDRSVRRLIRDRWRTP